jgi:KipI family sensor histidine kinase inhibitor
MRWKALGDSALMLAADETALAPTELAARVLSSGIEGITDCIAAPSSVAVYAEPDFQQRIADSLNSLDLSRSTAARPRARCIRVPVKYGEELHAVADLLGMAAEEVISLHCSARYTVSTVGFSPGFPYLTGLDPRLSLPRKPSPRRVSAGSVAIAGEHAGIYPFDSQGGWHVLGRTDLVCFNARAETPSLFRPGDKVEFLPVAELAARPRTREMPSAACGSIEVLVPGMSTTIQDLGRPGFRSSGVTPGGAADPVSAMVANILCGNDRNAAVLECTLTGPLLRSREALTYVCVGWGADITGRPLRVGPGEEIDLRGGLAGFRGVIAFAGGIRIPKLMNSGATDLRACFGGLSGRALRAGDVLDLELSNPCACHPSAKTLWPGTTENPTVTEIRFLANRDPKMFPDEEIRAFTTHLYEVSTDGDRTGMRLNGPVVGSLESGVMHSLPIVKGAVQIPPDGRPIVLLPECQTLGGYPQIGWVISADLPTLARARPGSKIRFVETGLDEARIAWRDLQRSLGLLETGWSLLR